MEESSLLILPQVRNMQFISPIILVLLWFLFNEFLPACMDEIDDDSSHPLLVLLLFACFFALPHFLSFFHSTQLRATRFHLAHFHLSLAPSNFISCIATLFGSLPVSLIAAWFDLLNKGRRRTDELRYLFFQVFPLSFPFLAAFSSL